MWVYLGDVIEENRFHNFVRESEIALLVLSSAGHERGNLIQQHSKQNSYLIQWFYSQLLRYNQPTNSEEGGEKAVFAGKVTMKQ